MDSFGGQNYPHRPLSPSDTSEIRIVKLYPGKFEDGIRCELMHVSLASEDAAYIALSYAWGPPDVTESIVLDFEQFPVTTNLESFFRQAQSMALAIAGHLPQNLRMPLPECVTLRNHIMQSVLQDPNLPRGFPLEVGSEFSSIVHRHVSEMGLIVDEQDGSFSPQTSLDSCYLTFWIDAICINQRDRAERSQQVGMMRDIYSRAQSTVIWLGDAYQSAEDVDLAFGLMRDIRQQVQPYLDDRAQWTEVVDLITSEEFVEPRISSITSLSQILTQAWFSRVWIIQEVATAQGPIVALLGSHPIQWKFLSHVVIPCCEYMTHSRNDRAVDIMFRTNVENVRTLRDLARGYADTMARRASSHGAGGSDNAPDRLYALLRRTCGSFKATDPRDIIYAILGLLGTATIPRELLPDYTASVGHVFHQTAMYLVRHLRRVDFLRFRKREDEDLAGVPTWVPDWRYVRMGEVRGYENPSTANVSEDGLGLELEGITLGTVATVVYPTAIAASVANTFIGGDQHPQNEEDYRDDTGIGVLTVVRGMQRLKELCLLQAQQAMPGRSLAGFQDAWERLWPDFNGQYQTLFEMVEERRRLDLTELVDGPSLPFIIMLGHKMNDIAETGLAITSGLQLFTAYRYDSPIDRDDVVVLVQGFRTPLILRPREDSFTFVGLCDLYSFQLDPINGAPDNSIFSLHQAERFRVV